MFYRYIANIRKFQQKVLKFLYRIPCMNFRTIFIANPKTGKDFKGVSLTLSGSIESISPKTDFTMKPFKLLNWKYSCASLSSRLISIFWLCKHCCISLTRSKGAEIVFAMQAAIPPRVKLLIIPKFWIVYFHNEFDVLYIRSLS